MSPAATGRARKPRNDVASASAAIASRDAADLRKGLRDRVCVGPTHPGRPDQYRVSVSTKCVATSGEAKLSADAGRRRRREARAFPTEAQSAKERRQIEEALKDIPADRVLAASDQGRTMEISLRVLAEMIDPARRLRQQDPIERYRAIVAGIRRIKGAGSFDVDSVQRRMVLRATLEHLRATAARPDLPQAATQRPGNTPGKAKARSVSASAI